MVWGVTALAAPVSPDQSSFMADQIAKDSGGSVSGHVAGHCRPAVTNNFT